MYRATFGSLFSVRVYTVRKKVGAATLSVLRISAKQPNSSPLRSGAWLYLSTSADTIHGDGEQQGQLVGCVDHGGLLAEVVGEFLGEPRVEHEQDACSAQHREPETETEVSGRPLEFEFAVDRPDDACSHGGRKHEDFDDEEFHDRPARIPVDVAARVASGDPQQAQRRSNPDGGLGSTNGRHSSAGPTPQFSRARFRQKQHYEHESQCLH
ncbi:hypothetical protein KL938_004324 [Ogataea parapolymorpha]|nr:hypothetical protein KL938_004324 [Ogataea parapolymorpha]